MSAATDKQRIIDEITRTTDAEIDRLKTDAERTVATRRAGVAAQIDAIHRKAADDLQRQVQRIEDAARTQSAVAAKRAALAVTVRCAALTIAAAEAQLAAMVDTEQYVAVLGDWIVDAVLAVDAPAVRVDCGPHDSARLPAACRHAAAVLSRLLEQPVELVPGSVRPEIGQGVVVTAADRPVAFTNSVAARRQRYQRAIQAVVGSHAAGAGERST